MTSVLFLLIQPNTMTEIRMQCWSEWTSGLTLRVVVEERFWDMLWEKMWFLQQ
jgi:hypothetical protein